MSADVRAWAKLLGFCLMWAIPVLGPIGSGYDLPWLTPTAIFIAVPAADAVIGMDRTRSERACVAAWWRVLHGAVPIVYLAIWLASLIWTARLLGHTPAGDTAALLASAGLASAFATCAAHELLHRPQAAHQWLARVTMSMCCYGHFVIGHLHHHATVGERSEGTVPFRGESMYAFIVRNAAFGYRNAYRIAEAARQRKQQAWLQNRVVQQHLLTSGLAVLFTTAFGWRGALLFAMQAAIAIATVEMVQYFEHYGLMRARAEGATASHAWNSNGWLTNAITLNITRHSHHHLQPSVPFQDLRLLHGAPEMPLGYFGLAWLAAFPPLWRAIIDPRLRSTAAAVDDEEEGQSLAPWHRGR